MIFIYIVLSIITILLTIIVMVCFKNYLMNVSILEKIDSQQGVSNSNQPQSEISTILSPDTIYSLDECQIGSTAQERSDYSQLKMGDSFTLDLNGEPTVFELVDSVPSREFDDLR